MTMVQLRRIELYDEPPPVPNLGTPVALKLTRTSRCFLVAYASDYLRHLADVAFLIQEIDPVVEH